MKSCKKIPVFLKIASYSLVNVNGLKYSEDTSLEFHKFSHIVQYQDSNVYESSLWYQLNVTEENCPDFSPTTQ